MEKIKNRAYHYGVQLVLFGAWTGIFSGIVVTLYNIFAHEAEMLSQDVYAWLRTNPVFIPLLFLALFFGAVIIGGIVKFIPMIRGSGIPQTEGATRGLIHYNWWQTLTGMFAASLFTIFMGLSAGSEGPSIMIGGACGYGSAEVFRRNETIRRYQITGGACAGLAVAFNAPLTGMAFAFEEAHKRFTPEVFICSFSSVIFAVLTRNLLRPAFGEGVAPTLTTYVFPENMGLDAYLFVVAAAVICGLIGVGFYFTVFRLKKLFAKITFWKGIGKMTVPFFIGGVFGLISVYAMGGGHGLLQALGGNMAGIQTIFSSPLWFTLLLVVVMKFIAAVVNMGAGVPCGVFIPMLAIGAGLGGLMSLLFAQMGMPSVYSDMVVIICMASFFTTVVKAPITGIVMTVELTWNFTFLLPVIVGVSIGYMIGDMFRTKPIYDELLDELLADMPAKKAVRIQVRLRVLKESMADGRAIRDILWPSNALVTSVERNGEKIVSDGETVLLSGDIITVTAETDRPEQCVEDMTVTVGERFETSEKAPEENPGDKAERSPEEKSEDKAEKAPEEKPKDE